MNEPARIRYAHDTVTPLYLGRTVRRLRKEIGMTQAELAAKARVTVQV